PGQVGPDLRPLHGLVQDVTALAAGQRTDHDVHALPDVAGHGRGALARLVVRVRVHRHQPQFPGAAGSLSWDGDHAAGGTAGWVSGDGRQEGNPFSTSMVKGPAPGRAIARYRRTRLCAVRAKRSLCSTTQLRRAVIPAAGPARSRADPGHIPARCRPDPAGRAPLSATGRYNVCAEPRFGNTVPTSPHGPASPPPAAARFPCPARDLWVTMQVTGMARPPARWH